MPVTEDPQREQLEALFGRFETTGCIVTASHLGLLSASLVTFTTPCSLNPPRLVVCTRNDTVTNEVVEQSRALAVHPVARGQEDWVAHFSQPTRDASKFESVKWRPGVTGSPILEEAVGYVEGEVIASLPAGDHTVRMIEPVGAVLRDANADLLTLREIVALGLV
ncbi:MAG TPA: flavin reductase family protein [Actinomycetota bacterium]|nr:flavin reductase family protein [Actinomycetota bacterium]